MRATRPAATRRARRTRIRRIGISLLSALLTLGVTSIVSTSTAHADPTYTFTEQKFDGATFPPADWQISSGAWTRQCSPTPPGGGCSAVDTVTATDPATSQMLFSPAQAIPVNLQNATLTFTSNFDPGPTSSGDSAHIYQPLQGSDLGDLRMLFDAANSGDTPGTPVTHSVSLDHFNLPLVFRWTSFGDTGTSPSKTWGISDVKITGTLPATAYTLTADPIPNTTYPHVVAGTPVTITLSGSSDPAGDSLNFVITSQPHVGTLGTVTAVDATHAKVTYSSDATACPDPNGTAGFLCIDQFSYKATDAQGNESAPATATLDVHPGGAGGQQIDVTAPTTSSYTTVTNGGTQSHVADLSGAVSVSPNGFPDAVEVHLHASAGTIDLLNGNASGVSYVNGTGNNALDVQFNGSINKVNTALGLFLYHPPDGTTPAETIDIYAADLGPTGQSGFIPTVHKTINIKAIVDVPRPVLNLPTGPLSIDDVNGPLTFPSGSATGISITDGGSTETTNDSVALNVSGGTLSVPASDTTGPDPLVTAQSDQGSLTLIGTVAHLNTALADITFDPATYTGTSVELSGIVSDPDTGLASLLITKQITVVHAPNPFGTTAVGTQQNVAITVYLCASGPPGAQLSYTITSTTTHGTLAVDPNGNPATSGCSNNPNTLIVGYRYTPNTGYVGGDHFEYKVTDASTGLSRSSFVDITVSAHTKPTAYDVSASTRQGQAVDVTLCGTNPDPSPALTFNITLPPGSGTLTAKGTPAFNPCNNGDTAFTYTYTPFAGSFTSDGTDSFTYVVTNGAFSDPATATITVATRTPHIAALPLTVNENSSIGFVICATTPNGALTFSFVGPSHGTLDTKSAATNGPLCPSGYFGLQYERYVPTQYYSGPDSIWVTATDGTYTSQQVQIPITVNFVEIPPTADDKSLVVVAPHAANVTLTGNSVHNLPLTYRIVASPTHGTLTGAVPNVVYTPSASSGTDSFTYVANDGTTDSAPATVHITITSPSLGTSVCYPGTTQIALDQFNCNASLPTVPDGTGGQVPLAHTTGARNAQLHLQVQVTNNSAAADDVTITAPAGTAPWAVRYDLDGGDQTDDITGAGVTVHLAAFASEYVQVIVFAPLNFPAPPTFPIAVHAASGNSAAVSASQPILVMDGSSAPSLALAQADGTGRTVFPAMFTVAPAMYVGGPSDQAVIDADLTGTGDNTIKIKADVLGGTQADVGLKFIEGTATDVTSQVLAGTFTMQCYADFGCPPLKAVLTPGSAGGHFEVQLQETSTIDGQNAIAFLGADVTSSVGPDFYTTPPRLGMSVFEPAPVTQVVTQSVQESGTATQRISLRSITGVVDTFSVKADVTGSGVVSITATPPAAFGTTGGATDVTAALRNGTYKATFKPENEVDFYVTVKAGATAGSDAARVVLTATSQLATSKVDSFAVRFPTYSYRPDEMITRPDGTVVGAQVYETGTGKGQYGFFETTLNPTKIRVDLAERGIGSQPGADSVLLKAPGSTADFDISYRLANGAGSTDVTAQITGDGLTVPLDSRGQTLYMYAASSATARTGRPGYFTISASSVPSGAADAVQVQLYTSGQSQLRFAGLPQPEPSDITQMVAGDGLTRTDPIPSRGYATGVTYGAYPDPSGQKFVYDSTYDNFELQIAAEKAVRTRHSLQLVVPNLTFRTTPAWQRDIFTSPYYNQGKLMYPADPLGADGVHPKVTVNGVDVTQAVLAGTYVTDPMRTGDTLNLAVSFSVPSGDSRRYAPIAFVLGDADTGDVQDVLTMGLSSIVECNQDAYGQQQIKAGTKQLNFRSYDRTNGGDECLQHLTHSWITKLPMVFGSDGGGDNPRGLWLLPQAGSVIRVDTDTLAVTSPFVKGYVDTALLGEDGLPDPTTYRVYNYVGTYQNLNWNPGDHTTGLPVNDDTALAPSPFPLVQPSTAGWPGNTMQARRYFQVQTTTGTPLMVGTMRVNEPWFHGDINLLMPVDSDTGLVLDYAAPPEIHASLPGDDGTESFGLFWTTRKDGTVTQGGCLGLPPQFFALIGVDKSYCIIGAVTTFRPISSDPNVEAKIASITFGLKILKFEVGTPEFNLKSLSGEIDLDPASGDVTKVVADATFGVGPVTPCYAAQKARSAGTVVSTSQGLLDKLCPKNYFTFDARITFQQGGFTSANSTTGYGIKFLGTLSFLGLVQLTSVEADISTSPFNFHFANSPIDLSVNAGIPIAAKITLEGDVGELGFDISLSGSISVMNQTIASASGILSTKGIGLCASLAGTSVGFGEAWGDDPTFYPSGCSTSQYRVTQ